MSRLDSKTLAEEFPALAQRFNAELTGFTAHEVTSKNPKKVWWTCESNHSFERTVSDTTKRGFTCSYCSGRLASPENNLRIHHPLLADMFDKADNGMLATEVTINSGGKSRKRWLCLEGHIFEKSIAETVKTKGVCFECNSLVYNHPALVVEFSSKNTLDVNTLSQGSNKKVLWECIDGHEWKMPVHKRTDRGDGCPYCAGRYATQERNLADLFPELAVQFDESKTGKPMYSFTPASNIKVWWKCDKGHSYDCSPNKKTREDLPYGCPYCSGYRVDDSNSLASLFPEIAKEFMEIENGVSPNGIPTGRSKSYLWRCSAKSHIFKASIATRTRREGGCPFCSGRYATPENNLLVVRPEDAKQFNIAKNGIRPEEITPFSNKMLWWNCDKGHEWKTTANGKKGCPKCILSATSKVEGFLYKDLLLSGLFDTLEQSEKINVRWRKNKTMNVDILGRLKTLEEIVIEYDGFYYHSGVLDRNNNSVVARDLAKTQALLCSGYKVIRVREKSSAGTLSFLNLADPNLLQIEYLYSSNRAQDFSKLIKDIAFWINS